MSFRCGQCKRALIDGQKPIQMVVERRKKTYPPRFKDNELVDKGGIGWEIVREVYMCHNCAT